HQSRDAAPPRLGNLPLARRDVERLSQIISLQRRLRDTSVSPRAQRALAHRHIFKEALLWLEIHGGAPDLVEHWTGVLADRGPAPEPGNEAQPGAEGEPRPSRRRRRRRRGRRRFNSTQ